MEGGFADEVMLSKLRCEVQGVGMPGLSKPIWQRCNFARSIIDYIFAVLQSASVSCDRLVETLFSKEKPLKWELISSTKSWRSAEQRYVGQVRGSVQLEA